MVTSGANQAFVNLVVSLVDATDRVVLFAPYYFNHLMALQMTGACVGHISGRHLNVQHPKKHTTP